MGERRRYFKVADSIAHEQWSNDELAMMVRLMSHMHERWARDGLTPEEASHCELGPAAKMHISGKHRVDVASMSLGHLADIASMSIEHRGDVTVIHWPKFPIFQGLPSRDGPKLDPKVPPPKTKTQTDPKEDSSGPPPSESVTCSPQELAEGWNEDVAKPFGLPSVSLPLSGSRLEKVRRRLKEHPDPFWWGRVWSEIEHSKFLRGHGSNGNGHEQWRCTFNWLIDNDSNATKVYEQQYRNGRK